MLLRFFEINNDFVVYETESTVLPHLGTDIIINDKPYMVTDIVIVYCENSYADITMERINEF